MSKIKRENVEPINEQGSPATKKVKVETVETETASGSNCEDVNGATRIKSKEGHVLYKCRQLILNIKNSLAKQKKDKCKETLDNWKKDLEELEKQLIIPKVTIAVVGATGAGKSSLINAVVDQFSVLPTSGTQACTSVVVKIENNEDGEQYEADIEFLSREEWQKEHDVLIKDMTKNDGTMKNNRPDEQSEAGVAFLKMRAVYGQFSSLDDLNGDNNITAHLGTMKSFKTNTLQEFSYNIEKYIISTEEEGQHLWPIIKSVTIRIPNFFTGCTLVDLPGVGDANAARDRIAQEHLENCSNILVVAEVHRAFSSKIAKELMGESFRRQLFMDGNYSCDNYIAFVCTKNDHLNCTELTRELKLDKNAEMMSLKNESEKLKKALNATVPGNERFQIEKDLSQTHQAMKVICGKARSEKARKQLKEDYKSGLRDMKRFAKQGIDKDDEDDEDDDDDDNDESADSLRVFCVSSNDYQCLKERNESPTVFDNVEDTEIPKLRKWIKEMVERKKQAATEYLMFNLAFFLNEIKNYLTENDVEFKDDSEIVKAEVEKVCEELQQELQNTSVKLLYELRKEISKTENNLSKGVKSAEETAVDVCKSWEELYKWQTYKAAVNRHGVYKSRSVGEINFNYQLVSPLIISILLRWKDFFNEDLWKILNNYNEIILEKTIRVYISKLSDKVKDYIPSPQLERLKERINVNAWQKLHNRIDELKDFVDHSQRQIHRLSSPKIQSRLKQIYEECSADEGKGVIQRMKMNLEKGIDAQRKDMFQEVSKEIVADLEALMKVIKEDILSVCTKLVRSIKTTFEPLWTHEDTQDLRSTIFDDVDKAEQELTALCGTFGIKLDFGSETRTGRSSPTAGKPKTCFSPEDLDKAIKQSLADYSKQHAVEERLKQYCNFHGMEFLGRTPGNGNCFFEAISAQLERLQLPRRSPERLRQEVTTYLKEKPTYKANEELVNLKDFVELEGDFMEYCESMSKNMEWADHVIVVTMARMLEQNIIIVTSSPETDKDDSLVWVDGGEGCNEKLPLLVGHYWEYHYQSLQPKGANTS
ncbi:nuclear GTPase SLIP-GC-like isoform X2 [Mytilus californianus]|uniref:nuclear GTPase SLIP-GC-like isoform X2 n=1 Tax=Mytilus californianus TaxID=6549 RepID=UPI0022480A00|nr:nuclear GTPase SLIP-GC-like isoform X2 [Mytilus californianus]